MNYKIILSISIINVSFLFSCGDKNKTAKDLGQSAHKIIVNPDMALCEVKVSDIFSNIEYVKLENGKDQLIGSITQLIPYKDRFYILDENQTNSVFCFQKNGKFLFKIDRKGKGPEEYYHLSGISIDQEKGELLLYCSSSHKIIVCDLNGNFLYSKKLDFYATRFNYINNGYSAFFCDFGSNQKMQKYNTFPNLIITKTDKYDVCNESLRFPNTVKTGAISMLGNCFSSFNHGTVTLLCPYNDTLYHITNDKVERAYYFDFGKRKKTDYFYNLLLEPTTDLTDVLQYTMKTDVCNLLYCIESLDHIFFCYQNRNAYHFSFYSKKGKGLVDAFKNYGSNSDDLYPIVNDIDGGLFYMPLATDGKVFYGVVEPNDILNRKDDILQSKAPQKHKLIQIMDELLISDNPIIVIQTPVNQTK
jgi:hypothetical protein